jgi:LysR family glycine cleavage system transcriptional activator
VPKESEIDIVLSEHPWHGDGTVTARFAADRISPMAAPALAAVLTDLPEKQRLDSVSLLHDESQNDWLQWFAHVGSSRREMSRGMNFSDNGLMLQAAAQGLGVCLGSETLAADFLARGTLVRVAETAMPARGGYHLSAWTRDFMRPAVGQLWDWMVAQSRGN